MAKRLTFEQKRKVPGEKSLTANQKFVEKIDAESEISKISDLTHGSSTYIAKIQEFDSEVELPPQHNLENISGYARNGKGGEVNFPEFTYLVENIPTHANTLELFNLLTRYPKELLSQKKDTLSSEEFESKYGEFTEAQHKPIEPVKLTVIYSNENTLTNEGFGYLTLSGESQSVELI